MGFALFFGVPYAKDHDGASFDSVSQDISATAKGFKQLLSSSPIIHRLANFGEVGQQVGPFQYNLGGFSGRFWMLVQQKGT